MSHLYETSPVGGPEQGPYLNAVCVLDTTVPTAEILDRALTLEAEMGRHRRERWGPRLLDIDVLVAGRTVVDQDGLRVPHPRLGERRFVLEPLVSVWPDLRLPSGAMVVDLLATVADQEVHVLEDGPWWR